MRLFFKILERLFFALLIVILFHTAVSFSTALFQPIQHNLTPNMAVIYLTPFIIWLAVFIVDRITPKLNPGIMLLIVSVVNIAIAFLTTVIVPGNNLWLQFAVGFGSTFFNEILKAFKK